VYVGFVDVGLFVDLVGGWLVGYLLCCFYEWVGDVYLVGLFG